MPALLPVETVLNGRYRITDVIAEGGMGVVYRATDERLARPVAVKTVGRDDPELMARLRREARLLARVSHPNVVRLYDVTDQDGLYCLVSELVEGTPLGRFKGQLTPAQIATIAEQIAGALSAAHARGIVHRDLKPSNVMIGDRARLLDFGIARHIDDSTLTTTDNILGTASYLAPEQLQGGVAGPPVDVYALGLVLIELFSGQPAFAGTFAETVAARLMGPPAVPDAVPESWHALIRAMTDPDPGRRPSASAVVEAIKAVRAAAPVPDATAPVQPVMNPSRPPTMLPPPAGTASAPPPPPVTADRVHRRRGRRGRVAAPVAAAAALAVAGVTATLVNNARSQEPGMVGLTDIPAAEAGPTPGPTTTGPSTSDVPLVAVHTPASVPPADAPAADAPASGVAASGVATDQVPPAEAPAKPKGPGKDNEPGPVGPPATAKEDKSDKGKDEAEPTIPTPTTTAVPDPGGGTEEPPPPALLIETPVLVVEIS
jgi:eukaryotic-like serine/threonine-protein kinase